MEEPIKFELDSSFIPRVIKPRKRRKKERNNLGNNVKEGNNLTTSKTFTFSSQDKFLSQSNNNNNLRIDENENHFSFISLSEQIILTQLNKSTSSCSCYICEPHQKIWAFSKQKVFNETEFEIEFHINNNTDNIESNEKKFGAVGSDRYKK